MRQLTSDEIAHNASLNLSAAADNKEVCHKDLDILGDCFSLTPKSTVEEMEKKRCEIWSYKGKKAAAFRDKVMGADTDDVFLTSSLRSITLMRARFLELVEMYAEHKKIVGSGYEFQDPPPTPKSTPQRK